jgi:prepilin-type N-terminal cleavage/methylation domain-containing protein
MAPVTPAREDGFSLVEVLVAMSLLVVGVLALEGAVSFGARQLTASQDQLIAGERAAEAVESVFKARDNQTLQWTQIKNVLGGTGADNGIFLDGARTVRDVGLDGLVNTADDGAVAQVVKPGNDGLLGTADDVVTPLYGFTREIEIRVINPNLRQLRVIVRYRSSNGPAQYIITTYISAYA